jgi:hypothetical protein
MRSSGGVDCIVAVTEMPSLSGLDLEARLAAEARSAYCSRCADPLHRGYTCHPRPRKAVSVAPGQVACETVSAA